MIGGSYPNAATAREAASGTCVSAYWVLPARSLGLQGQGVVLAAITTGKALAEAALKATDRSCGGQVARRVAEVRLAAMAQQ